MPGGHPAGRDRVQAAFLSYNDARRAARDPEAFGNGDPRGVAAAECGNNADNAAALIPALTLGIPGSSVTAVILWALVVSHLPPRKRSPNRAADVRLNERTGSPVSNTA